MTSPFHLLNRRCYHKFTSVKRTKLVHIALEHCANIYECLRSCFRLSILHFIVYFGMFYQGIQLDIHCIIKRDQHYWITDALITVCTTSRGYPVQSPHLILVISSLTTPQTWPWFSTQIQLYINHYSSLPLIPLCPGSDWTYSIGCYVIVLNRWDNLLIKIKKYNRPKNKK